MVEECGVQVTDILIKRFHEDQGFGNRVVEVIEGGLFRGDVRPVKHEVVEGEWGLGAAVEAGLKKLKDLEVSGRKLVVNFA